tara:strand:+ start:1268 stop:1837 length:570 start_codon:yes stop_codon:yes gene_type:complete
MYKEKGYEIVRGFISEELANFLWGYFELNAYNKIERIIKDTDTQVERADSVYGDPAFDHLGAIYISKVEKITGKILLPTYTYGRLYKVGSKLEKHKDRPACEHSVSVCLGEDIVEPWPLMFKDFQGEVGGAYLKPGDAVVYKGTDLEHWREPFKGKRQGQLFLHYVDKDGPYSDWVYDKREFLGRPSVN